LPDKHLIVDGEENLTTPTSENPLEWIKRFFRGRKGTHDTNNPYEKTTLPFNPCELASRGLTDFCSKEGKQTLSSEQFIN